MSPRARRMAVAIFGSGLLAFLCWGLGGLSPFGHYPGPYGDILNAAAPGERHVQNVVAAVIFDYRGFDTLGEEYILFASVTGVILLLRRQVPGPQDGCGPRPARREPAGGLDPAPSEAVQWLSLGFIGAIIAFGIYIVVTGHLSLGGGFQGGVILSAAWLLVLLACGAPTFHRLSNPSVLEWFEAAGAGAYALIGCVALMAGRSFLTNVVPLGRTGQLLSSGTILLINCAVGVEVTAGFVLLLVEFVKPLEQETPLRNP